MIFVMLNSKTKVNSENYFPLSRTKEEEIHFLSPQLGYSRAVPHENSPPNAVIFERKEGLPRQNSPIAARDET